MERQKNQKSRKKEKTKETHVVEKQLGGGSETILDHPSHKRDDEKPHREMCITTCIIHPVGWRNVCTKEMMFGPWV